MTLSGFAVNQVQFLMNSAPPRRSRFPTSRPSPAEGLAYEPLNCAEQGPFRGGIMLIARARKPEASASDLRVLKRAPLFCLTIRY